jgi:septal ring factor EnvC (AmiA/AmiB activator)|tara:strand:+ start:49 stop:279 length:231 start_codon:yes stop_codon:yes gene_type:complete
MSSTTNPSQIKDWITFAMAMVAAVASIIFWVQNADKDKIQHIEGEVAELKQDMKAITKQNSEILRLIGRIEGSMGK